jgi:hypothetical protein
VFEQIQEIGIVVGHHPWDTNVPRLAEPGQFTELGVQCIADSAERVHYRLKSIDTAASSLRCRSGRARNCNAAHPFAFLILHPLRDEEREVNPALAVDGTQSSRCDQLRLWLVTGASTHWLECFVAPVSANLSPPVSVGPLGAANSADPVTRLGTEAAGKWYGARAVT